MTDVYRAHENVDTELSRDDLTQIKGIGTTTAEKLYNAKIISIKQIAEMTPERLSETPGIGLATALKFITAARNHLGSSQKEVVISEPIQIQEETKVESAPTSIEQYEVEEDIVEEKELEPEEKTNINSKTEESVTDVDFDVQPEIRSVIKYEEDTEEDEELRKETPPEMSIIRDKSKIEYVLIEPKIIEIKDSRESSLNDSVQLQISNIFNDVECYEIPSELKNLKQFTNSLDYLGCKLVKTSEDLRILLLFPVIFFNQEGTVVVKETKLELKSYSKKRDFEAFNDVNLISRRLLQVRDLMNNDMASDNNILNFFQKYLQITLSFERGYGNKSLVFLSGSTQYKVFIEPILLCNNPPRSMEKSFVFPYQRRTNLHVVSRTDLAPLIKFLEKKYRMIENRTKKPHSVKNYRNAEETFRSNVKYASIPIFGYSVALLVIYFAELYFLLRLFNTVGLAVVGIYLSLLAFFYFRAHKIKKAFKDQYETPHYLQNLEFSETDLLDFGQELTDELLTQFGYECLGKDVKFGVLEQSETNSLKHSIESKRKEPQFQNIFEPEQAKAEIVSNSPTKYGKKYSSFLEDS